MGPSVYQRVILPNNLQFSSGSIDTKRGGSYIQGDAVEKVELQSNRLALS